MVIITLLMAQDQNQIKTCLTYRALHGLLIPDVWAYLTLLLSSYSTFQPFTLYPEQVVSQRVQHSQIFCTYWLLFGESPPHLGLNATSWGKPFLSSPREAGGVINLSVFELPPLKQYASIFYDFLIRFPTKLSFLRVEQVFAYPTPGINPSTK